VTGPEEAATSWRSGEEERERRMGVIAVDRRQQSWGGCRCRGRGISCIVYRVSWAVGGEQSSAPALSEQPAAPSCGHTRRFGADSCTFFFPRCFHRDFLSNHPTLKLLPPTLHPRRFLLRCSLPLTPSLSASTPVARASRPVFGLVAVAALCLPSPFPQHPSTLLASP
jgi:hypothetical protein